MADIALLVATARTCREIITHALPKGYNIRAIVRSEARFRSLYNKNTSIFDDKRLSIHEIDVNNVASVKTAIAGTKVVFIAAGGSELESIAYINQPIAITLIAAIRQLPSESRPNRIVLLSSHFCHPDFVKEEGQFKANLVTNHLLISPYLDLVRAQDIFEKNKDVVEYTFLQAGVTVNADTVETADKKIEIVQDYYTTEMVATTDVAKCMLDVGFADEYKNVAVGMKQPSLPKPGLKGMGTQFSAMGIFAKRFVIVPAAKALLWVMLGYLLKEKVFYDQVFNLASYFPGR